MADSINEPMIDSGLFTFDATSSTADGPVKDPEFLHPSQASGLLLSGRTLIDQSSDAEIRRKRQGNPSQITSSKRRKSGSFSFDHSKDVGDDEKTNYETNRDIVVQDLHDRSAAGDCAGGLAFCDGLPEAHTDGMQTDRPIADVVKELGQEGKMLSAQWIQIFDDSENFEQFCPARLDKILQEARELEESLKQQKEILCRRLQGLSQTLQML